MDVRNCSEVRDRGSKTWLPLSRQLCPDSTLRVLSPRHIAALLEEEEEDFSIPKNRREKVCIVLMSWKNTKCIEFVVQFILNNSALRKGHPK